MSKKNYLLIMSALLTGGVQANINSWQGTINTTNVGLTGSVDYVIDTVNDTLTLSNHSGQWATRFGPMQTFILYALNDTSSSAGSLHDPTSSTFDVTNELFAISPAAGLASVANDGWYWASATSDSFFHLLIGADDRGPSSPILDYDGTTSNADGSAIISSSSAPGSAGEFGFSQVTLSAVTAVPEPNSTALLGLATAACAFHRKRRS